MDENELVMLHDKTAVTTSLNVAANFEKDHSDVMDAIKNLTRENSGVKSMFSEGTYMNSRGREYPMYYMNRDGFSVLAMGFNGSRALDFKLQYIEAFNRFESAATKPKKLTPIEQLKLNSEVVIDLDSRVKKLEDDQKLDPGEYSFVSHAIGKRVKEYVDTFKLSKRDRGLLYKDINGGVIHVTGAPARSQLLHKDFKRVCEYVQNWVPSTATLQLIQDSVEEMK